MKKIIFKIFAATFVLLTSCKAQEKVVVKNNVDSLETKMPTFSWNTMPLYMHIRKATAFTNKEITYLSKFPLITFEKTTGSKTFGSTDKGTIIAAKAVKELNPNAKILYYRNVVINWPSYEADEAFLKEHPDAYLMSKKGGKASMPGGKTGFFDLSKDFVREHWLNHITEVTSSPYIDGVFMDANIKILSPGFFGNRSGKEKQKEIEAGYLSMMQNLNTRYGKDNILLANILRVRPNFKDVGRTYLKFFDGSYLEGVEHEAFGMTYEDYLAKGIDAFQRSAREGKIIAMSLGIGEASDNDHAGIDDVRRKIKKGKDITERLDYLLAIFLVCAEKHSYVYPHDGYASNRSSVWMKTFPQYQKNLGAPKGYAKKDGYIYTRSFEYLDVTLDIKNKTAKLDWK